MKMDFITFRSITPAQRGQRLLQQNGIGASIQRTPRWMEEQGCGYCLRLREQDLQLACQLLRQANVPFSKVFVWQGEKLQEMPL